MKRKAARSWAISESAEARGNTSLIQRSYWTILSPPLQDVQTNCVVLEKCSLQRAASCSIPLPIKQLGQTYEALWILVAVAIKYRTRKKCRKGIFYVLLNIKANPHLTSAAGFCYGWMKEKTEFENTSIIRTVSSLNTSQNTHVVKS